MKLNIITAVTTWSPANLTQKWPALQNR